MLPTMMIIRDTISLPRTFLKFPELLANDSNMSVITIQYYRRLLEIAYIAIITKGIVGNVIQ